MVVRVYKCEDLLNIRFLVRVGCIGLGCDVDIGYLVVSKVDKVSYLVEFV